MMTKTQLINNLDSLPERFSIDELIEKLILIQKIEIGNLQSDKGEVLTEGELDKEIAKWFK